MTKAEKKCAKEIHCVGQIWASALFELRVALGNDTNGQSVMDRVALESNFLLTKKSGYKDGGRALLAADQLLYAGAHIPQIQAVMTARKFCSDVLTRYRAKRRARRGFREGSRRRAESTQTQNWPMMPGGALSGVASPGGVSS